MFGSPETTTGGNALKFYASQRLDIRRVGTVKKAEDSIGNRTRVRVVKNKLAPPFKESEFDILFGEGVSKLGEVVDLGADLGIIDKSGAWFSFDGNRIGQGRDNSKAFLQENPRVAEEIERRIRVHFGLTKDGAKEDHPSAPPNNVTPIPATPRRAKTPSGE
jgi:recombination protein RecA